MMYLVTYHGHFVFQDTQTARGRSLVLPQHVPEVLKSLWRGFLLDVL